MLVTAAIVWCLTGIASILWLSWDREAITWGQLAFCVGFGSLVGPSVWVIIAAKVFVGADFWSKRIFGKSK